jgi:hypothetical protein
MAARAQSPARASAQVLAPVPRVLARAAVPQVRPLAAKPAPLARFAQALWSVFQPL